jgi:hypothetical protein
MRKGLFMLIMVFCSLTVTIVAQEVEARLQEARQAYNAGNLDVARTALQQAMNEVDLAIGREVLKVLPATMGDMPAQTPSDEVASAAMGYAGLYVQRTYGQETAPSVSLQVLADSPMLAGVNALLALPILSGDANQKRVRVGNYRAVLQKSPREDGPPDWDLQVPFGSSLMTLSFKGIDEEGRVLELANTVPVDQVARLIR